MTDAGNRGRCARSTPFRAAILMVPGVLAGCSAQAPRAGGAGGEPAADAIALPDTADPGASHPATSGLPPGRGRAILARACTACHNLEGLQAYKGYYDAGRWRGLVQTMIAHGAELDETEAAELVQYLAEHFGPGSP